MVYPLLRVKFAPHPTTREAKSSSFLRARNATRTQRKTCSMLSNKTGFATVNVIRHAYVGLRACARACVGRSLQGEPRAARTKNGDTLLYNFSTVYMLSDSNNKIM